MAKNGFKAFDSDMHVYDHPDLYTKYMNPKWGERVPVAKGWNKHGRPQFSIGGGTKLRPREALLDYGEQRVEERYGFALARGYDAVSQVQAMDMEGLDVVVLLFAPDGTKLTEVDSTGGTETVFGVAENAGDFSHNNGECGR